MLIVPERLAVACRDVPERSEWLARLPDTVRGLEVGWSLALTPLDSADASCSWVAFAQLRDGTPAVLKLGIPHMEAEHEIHGLRFWNGDGIIRLLDADEDLNAMLLERCEPGTPLRAVPEEEQDVVIARLLRRLWQKPRPPHPFRPLSSMLGYWASETRASADKWLDRGLVNDGLRVFEELSRPSDDDVLLATDLHAGNVLRAQRDGWLAIDPKPFVGDRAYDATQHLLNCTPRVIASIDSTISRFADLLEIEVERVRLWMFARAAAEPRDVWNEESVAFAKAFRI
jgi:streptomycin 6-kinase